MGAFAAAVAAHESRGHLTRRKMQKALDPTAFGPEAPRMSVRSVALRPTAGLEINLLEESRALAVNFNFRRLATVREALVCVLGAAE